MYAYIECTPQYSIMTQSENKSKKTKTGFWWKSKREHRVTVGEQENKNLWNNWKTIMSYEVRVEYKRDGVDGLVG